MRSRLRRRSIWRSADASAASTYMASPHCADSGLEQSLSSHLCQHITGQSPVLMVLHDREFFYECAA